MTDGHAQDPTVVPERIEQPEGDVKLGRFAADGICDNATVYEAIKEHQAGVSVDVVVPPRRNAVPSENVETAPTQRDTHIATMQSAGLFQWRWESGYYAHSGAGGAARMPPPQPAARSVCPSVFAPCRPMPRDLRAL